jgi:replicative DNA helicase
MDIIAKIPPQAIDAEKGLLAAIMVNPDVMDDVLITPEMFYNSNHSIIFTHIKKLYDAGTKPDIITLNESLQSSGEIQQIGGVNYLMQLTETVVTDKYAVQHAHIIKEKYLRRQYISTADELQRMSYNEYESNIDDIADYAEQSLYNISEDTIQVDPELLSDINTETIEYIRKISEQKTELIGVPSGIVQLDRLTLGFQKSDLILIAARPSMGKTAFSLNISREAAILGYKVLFFSLEMSKRQLSYRLLANRFTDISDLKLGKDVEWDMLNRQNGEYAGNIYVDDTPALRATEIRSISRKLKKRADIDMVIVDYLQLARGDELLKQNGNRYIGDISKKLKSLAKELNIPVIAVSQLNRAVESRANPFPILSDLRESGELEQDADIVIFLTRFIRLPEKYWYDDGNDMRDKAYIDVAKNRNGKCSKILITASEDAMFWGY